MKLIGKDNPKLKIVSTEVEEKELNKALVFAKNLTKTLSHYKNGVGLSAPQVGYNKRIFIMRWGGNTKVVINPIITKKSWKKTKFTEGCLSYPNIFVKVKRPFKIKVKYIDNTFNKVVEEELVGMVARIFQHEFDHLNGICKVGDNT